MVQMVKWLEIWWWPIGSAKSENLFLIVLNLEFFWR